MSAPWKDRVVPIAVKLGVLEIQRIEFRIGYFDPGWIFSRVQLGANAQTGTGFRVRDQVNNDLVTDQRAGAPVLGDVAEHTMLDLVPFAGAWREMADMHRESQARR